MAILDTVRNGVINAVDTVSAVTQTIIERNRLNAQLNRLRAVMKSECEMINRAYITLGKQYYENKINNKSEACENEQELFEVIENSKESIRRARERYRRLLDSKSVDAVQTYDIGDLEDITVACSNEDEYEESPFKEQTEPAAEPAAESVQAAVDAEVEENDSF